MSNNNVAILSPKHIDFVLTYANECGLHFQQVEHGRIVRKFNANVDEDLNTLGQYLTAINVAAVNYAYREDQSVPKYTFRMYRLGSDDSEVQVLKALDCYEHQCEALPQYRANFAREIIETIRQHAITQLPGYRGADWEIAS